MQRLLIALLIIGQTVRLHAEALAEHYAQYGQVIVVNLDSAPFPHPARMEGHTYDKQFYSTADHYTDNSVAIFVPKGFRATSHVDYIVHFHGWRHDIENTLNEYKLIEQLSASGRNAILVVPVGAKDVPDSFGGKMEDQDGFKHLMNDIAATLNKRGVTHNATIGKIIVSGHSGGYGPLGGIVSKGGMGDKVTEVWLLDALYAGTEKFLDWYRQYPNRRLIDIYTKDGGTMDETQHLMVLMSTATPQVSFLSKNEKELKPGDLQNNGAIFIYSDFPHDKVVYGANQYCEFLKTSGFRPIHQNFVSPKQSER